jgi:hypothetical protein
LFGAVGTAAAAPVSTAVNGNNGAFTVSGTDLANAGNTAFSSIAINDTANRKFGSNEDRLNNGIIYSAAGVQNTDETLTPGNNTVVTITFNTGTNTLGYDIKNIVSLTGTGQQRRQQNYQVDFSQVGSAAFAPLFTVTPALPQNTEGDGEVQVTTADPAGAPLATGVDQLRLTFFDAPGGGGPEKMYREFDVNGSPTAVPEPAAGLLIGLAGLASLRRRTR